MRRPVPTSASARRRRFPPSLPAPSCCPQSRSSPGARSGSCCRPRSSAAPAAHSTASQSGSARRRRPRRSARAALSARPSPIPARGSHPQSCRRPGCGRRGPAGPPWSPQSPPGRSSRRCQCRWASAPIPAARRAGEVPLFRTAGQCFPVRGHCATASAPARPRGSRQRPSSRPCCSRGPRCRRWARVLRCGRAAVADTSLPGDSRKSSALSWCTRHPVRRRPSPSPQYPPLDRY